MQNAKIEQELALIFKESFGLDHINDSTSIFNVAGWDSMAHVSLIMTLQQQFNVSIPPADAIELTDIASIKKFLKAKILKRF